MLNYINELGKSLSPKIIPKTFFFPTVEEYPFDTVCKNIVQALHQRGWNVPGITVEFDEYFKGHAIAKRVSEIKGADFYINFSRVQSREGNITNMAAASTIGIPKWLLSVYGDHSGPSFYVYVGNNWEAEKSQFFTGLKVNSKLCGEPRTYLAYTGSPYKNANMVKHTNDIGREYDLQPGDMESYPTKTVYNTIAEWLSENVLNVINTYPVTTPVEVESHTLNPFTDEEKSKLPFEVLTVLTSKWETYEKIRDNFQNEMELPPEKRYAFVQNTRLLNLGVEKDDTITDIMYDGFIWSEPVLIVDFEGVKGSLLYRRSDIDGGMSIGDTLYSVAVVPKYSNEVYVIDASAREEFKRKYFESHPELKSMEDKAYDDFLKIEARTLVTLTAYDGSYKEPMVIFRRNVELDEIVEVRKIKIDRTRY